MTQEGPAPANPFGGQVAAPGGTIWQFALAALVLYGIMRYVPYGKWIGGLLLIGAVLHFTSERGSWPCDLLTFLGYRGAC